MIEKIAEKKSLLRREIHVRLRNMDAAARAEQSASISEHVRAWLMQLARPKLAVALFRNFSREVSMSLIDATLIDLGAIRYLPVIFPHCQLGFSLLPPEQPVDTHTAASVTAMTLDAISNLDIIFVPGLAFDFAGHRLGRGEGYYDRALAKRSMKNAPLMVGVAFDEQVVEMVPCEGHDVVMDYLCTPSLGMHKTKDTD